MLEEAKAATQRAGTQRGLCRHIVDNMRQAQPGALTIEVSNLVPLAADGLGIKETVAEELLIAVLEQWQLWGFAEQICGQFWITSDGITFAHHQVIREELRWLRGELGRIHRGAGPPLLSW